MTLFDACLTFDSPRIRELLEQAPLGYQPQSAPVDLVWAQQSTQAQTPDQGAQGDPVVVLRPGPASSVS